MDFEAEFSSLTKKVMFAKARAEISGREVRIKITKEFYHKLRVHMICRFPYDIREMTFMGCCVEITDIMEVTIVEIVR